MTEDFLTFPDGPRVELDRVIGELVEQAREVLTTQGRLRALLRANQAVALQLDLPVVLRRIVEVAVELVGARYGALGVISPHGGLDEFIHVGMPADAVDHIGHLPEGRGLLGALIDDPRPIRLDQISDDARSVGFPAGHPPMDSFLGVPVRVRDTVYGNLYLSHGVGGHFTAEDEQLIGSLAATAGFAIDNARLFAQTRRQEAWSAASAEITAALLETSQTEALAMLADAILRLSDADLVAVMFPTDDPAQLVVQIARGVAEEALPGARLPAAGSIAGGVLEGRQPRLLDDAGESFALHEIVALGPMMAVPVIDSGRVQAVIVIGRLAERVRFLPSDLEMAADFAAQGSIAMELARGRADRTRMVLLEDRGRIARDLHDHVIQQLFATGLDLQSVAGAVPASASERITQAVAGLDTAIAQIRTAVFALSTAGQGSRPTLRHRVIGVVNEFESGLLRPPTVRFSGAVDLMVTADLADDVIAVTREALANVVKHAAAEHASVAITTADGGVTVTVTDDGRGPGSPGHRSGLANLEERARRRGGSFTFDSAAGDTRLTWQAPFAADAASGDERPAP
ncbi:GAF domain-containing sensor histidine kinase [Glaciibacter superstes]|uniref:GAF domain-containing sensor histidine kinase n=1 Tax=Glaciibacter superstes TaxID=501023 RepID=UPI0003B56B92|nr:GAF domain-containing protein [Glaciibacter superstes]